MTPAGFLQSFPEFAETSPVLINAKLQQAAARMGGPDFTIWPAFSIIGQPPSLSDIAHGSLAAHYLSSSQFGLATRLEPSKGDGKTPYLRDFEEYEIAVTGGFITAGEMGGIVLPNSGGSGSLVLSPGTGTVAVVNGSTAIVFTIPQTFGAGTIFAFVGAQPGALYVLAFNITASTSATLTAPYSGVSTAASAWNSGAG